MARASAFFEQGFVEKGEAFIEARVGGLNGPWLTALAPWPGGLTWVLAEVRQSSAAALRDRIATVGVLDSGDADDSPE